ncbi:hypothetical protein DSM106972_097990 [Dulcicalothrix desertica PCC 7102]|uniref:Uncharacterized protein n=2 Tax=Dulcicalothrix desertica TaxID=32056 RepID=A0A433UGE1_9CYAN|nr:hypothetical protein DSM106972_097990 [Dulcicalothrix desertica PCC 7102]
MQLRTLSQQPDLKTSLSQAERYGHHLDAIQCAGLSTTAPIQMLSTLEEEEKKLTSSMDLEINKDVKNSSPNLSPYRKAVLNVASSSSKTFNKEHRKEKNIKTESKKDFNEKNQSAKETSESKEKDKKQNQHQHLTSPTNKNSEHKATEDSSHPHDPEVKRLLNKQTQDNLAQSNGGAQKNNQQKNEERFVAPPSTYDEKKSAPSPKVGTHSQYLAKREAMDMLGNNKRFTATQRAVKNPVINTHKSDTHKSRNSKAEDSKRQVKLKNAAELVRDQVINEDRQVKEHLRGTLNLDPVIVAKQGGEELILQEM